MITHGIPAGRVFRAPDMLADPQFQARESIVELEHPRLGAIKMQNAFPFFSETPTGIRRLAPESPGQDNDEVLREVLAMSASDIEGLRAAGTI